METEESDGKGPSVTFAARYCVVRRLTGGKVNVPTTPTPLINTTMLLRHSALFLVLAFGAVSCTPQGGETGSGSTGTGGASPSASGGAGPSASGGSSGGTTSSGGSGGGSTATGGATGGAASGGAAGPAGSGGSPGPEGSGGSGAGGAEPSADAGPSGTGGAGPAPAPTGAAEPESLYTCTHLIGINATEEWFSAGFETMVDNAKWQIVRVHSGFVDLWAQPGAAVWNTGVNSPCAMNSKTPDRIIFIGLKFEWTDKKLWVDALTAVVKNLKDKFPGVKRIELGSFVRGPGNKPCSSRPAYRSTIHPSQDDAIAEVVATDPVLLRASPKFEVSACSDFSGNPPHFSGGGAKTVAGIVGKYYSGKN